MKSWFVCSVALAIAATTVRAQEPSYALHVRPFLAKYCSECHNAKVQKGGLNLDTFKAMLEGGDNGAVVVPGKAEESRLVVLLQGKEKPIMPPSRVTMRPKREEIARVAAWVNAGARDDSGQVKVALPDLRPTKPVTPPVTGLVFWPLPGKPHHVVLARHQRLRIEGQPTSELPALRHPITALVRADATHAILATGQHGVEGRLHILTWMPDEKPRLQETSIQHEDSILDVAVSPKGDWLASCDYDGRIRLARIRRDGKAFRLEPGQVLKDHSDSANGLAFHPEGKLLASCSADRTVKVWDPAQARLLFTLSEATDWLLTVAWSPDGKTLAAAGVDKSIRLYHVTAQGGKIVHSVFAHEGPVLKLAFAADGQTLYSLGQDRIVKAWDVTRMSERRVFSRLNDDGLTLAVHPTEAVVAVGTYEGTVRFLEVESGKVLEMAEAGTESAPRVSAKLTSAQKPARMPVLKTVTPGEVPRGRDVRLAFEGEHLDTVTELTITPASAVVKVVSREPGRLVADVHFAATTTAGIQSITVRNEGGTSTPVSLTLDAYPVSHDGESVASGREISLPTSIAGHLDRAGAVRQYHFKVTKGQSVGVQVTPATGVSKLEPLLQLSDPAGRVLAESERGFLGHTFEVEGPVALTLRDRELRGGAEYRYRLHIGEIPVVSALFPLGGQAGREVEVRLEGTFLASRVVRVKIPEDARTGTQVPVPVTSKWGTPLGTPRLEVGEYPDAVDASRPLPVPGTANGVVGSPGRAEIWQFKARRGERLVIETAARRIGSTLDSVIEVLDDAGRPLPRAVLRCQAKTYVTFRDHDSVQANIRLEHWSELAVNDLLYVGNELIKIKQLPIHPDADCTFFSARGQRLAYLDTTPTHHSNNLPMYKVGVHPPGTIFPPNGFPVFTLHYRNDDGGPGYGRDSRLFFEPPADGTYRIRVSDARGQGGLDHGYRLTVRPPRPGFKVSLAPGQQSIARGSAVSVALTVDRIDGYEGPIELRFEKLPDGFDVPVTRIGPGDSATAVALHAAMNAKAPAKNTSMVLVGEAVIDGRKHVERAEAKLPTLMDDPGDLRTWTEEATLTLRPGGEVRFLAHIERRHGFTGRVPLEVRGLPHGVKVLDVGLNGILVTERESQRVISLYAEPWVEPLDYPVVVLARREGKNTEHAAKAVILKVRR